MYGRSSLKVKKNLGRVFYIIAAVCVFLHVVILSLSFFYNNQQEKYCRSVIPDREYQTDEDNRRFVFSAQEIKDGENCLRFYTAHMEVSVYADDTLIYHVGQQAMPKVSPGVVWNYVGIPSGAEQNANEADNASFWHFFLYDRKLGTEPDRCRTPDPVSGQS